jgi:hypothetical protein
MIGNASCHMSLQRRYIHTAVMSFQTLVILLFNAELSLQRLLTIYFCLGPCWNMFLEC